MALVSGCARGNFTKEASYTKLKTLCIMNGHERNNWLFAGSLRAGQRAANVMTLIQSAKLNGHDPYRYLKDVLERLPTQQASRINDLLPHLWRPSSASALP